MTRIALAVLLLLGTAGVMFAQRSSANDAARTARQPALKVTGHYRLRFQSTSNRMEVLQLPAGQIKFHILALWISSYNPDNVHNGEVQGTAALKDDTAVYQDEHCKLSIKFSAGRATVQQFDDAGDCDFGVNVSATGTYRKLDSNKPKFDF